MKEVKPNYGTINLKRVKNLIREIKLLDSRYYNLPDISSRILCM